MRIGAKQLEILIILATPDRAMIVPGKTERGLIQRGLLKVEDNGGFARITPAGLRALADAMEAGRVEDCLMRMKRKTQRRLP
jgi:hypothetical protein